MTGFSPKLQQELLDAIEDGRKRLRALTSKMEPQEAELLPRVLGSEKNYDALVSLDYEREPVSVRQFIYDDYYLGKIMTGNVYETLVRDVEELFAGDYTECILGGGIGFGKTRLMEMAIAYDLYKITCLRDPARAYGMLRGSNMTFVNISVNKTQATKVFFQDLYNLLSASPYFNLIARFDKNFKSEIRFQKKNIRCYPVAASEQAALGTGVFCACIDEANFMDVVERSKRAAPGEQDAYDQAEAVFRKLSSRIRSRMSNRGRLPGHIYVASSARYPDDFVERLFKLAEEERAKGIHEMFTRRYATWETNPGKFSKETFRVEVGDITRRSRVLTTEDKPAGQVIEVPMDFYRPFAQDADRAVREIGGISVMSIKPFIGQREKIAKMFALGKQMGLMHPFTRQNVTLQESDPKLERLLEKHLHWVQRYKTNPATGAYVFENGQPVGEDALFPAMYCAHIDLSKSGDATGLVIAHNTGAVKVMRFDAEKMKDVEETKPIIRVDLALRIVAPKRGEIDVPRIRAILYELNRHWGMPFGLITADTFGSQEMIKTLKDEGFNADILSMDKDMTPYETLRTALYDERVVCYMDDENGNPVNQVLERELVQLERGPKKIDHPATHAGSKDMADALAGAVYNCEAVWRAGESSRGLFQIGAVENAGQMSPQMQERQGQIITKVAQGHAMNDQDENDLLFGDLDKL